MKFLVNRRSSHQRCDHVLAIEGTILSVIFIVASSIAFLLAIRSLKSTP